MSGSKAQCSISDRGAAPALVMDDLIEDDGFITVMASGWTPTSPSAPRQPARSDFRGAGSASRSELTKTSGHKPLPSRCIGGEVHLEPCGK